MKTAVITRHAISNYGSLLQALATQEVIESLGHECEIIDYVRYDETPAKKEKTQLSLKPGWNGNPLKRALYLALRTPESIDAGRAFEKFRKKHLKLSKRYSDIEQLRDTPPKADVFVTGSDQVWGPVADGSIDPAYCLSFTEGRKIAFSASFGKSEITDELKDFFRKHLSSYSAIAVREDSAVGMLDEIGLRSVQVLDPTLMVGKEEWKSLLEPIREKDYVLIYQLHNDKKLGAYAQKVAKSLGKKLIRVSPTFHQCAREGRFVYKPSVGKFLSYIKNAELMITDSFHGTAFAINFNTDFVEVLPDKAKTESRNLSILRLTGLQDRILKNENDIRLAGEKIDFSFANEQIEAQRRRSLEILRKMIEG